MNDNRTFEEKLAALANGEEVEFTEAEAEQLGAFEETALTPEEAEESRHHNGGVTTEFEGILEPPTFYTKKGVHI